MTAYTEPRNDDLSKLAAEAMGFRIAAENLYEKDSKTHFGKLIVKKFHPERSHDHAQILVDEAFKRGLDGAYRRCLFDACHLSSHPNWLSDTNILRANPEQKTRAFLRTVHESKP